MYATLSIIRPCNTRACSIENVLKGMLPVCIRFGAFARTASIATDEDTLEVIGSDISVLLLPSRGEEVGIPVLASYVLPLPSKVSIFLIRMKRGGS
jgi:hypothetical protein